MKQRIQYSMLFIVVLGLGAGCISNRQAGKLITVTPSPYVLTPDSADRVKIDLVFRIPASYFSQRERLVVTPQLIVEDTVRDNYLPVVLDGSVYCKKRNRKQALEGYQDPYQAEARQVDNVGRSLVFSYKQILQLPYRTAGGRIIAIVSVEGCASCAEIDTIEVAVIGHPILRREKVVKTINSEVPQTGKNQIKKRI